MAGLWCVGRQKQFQPLAVLAGFSGGAAGLGLWLLPKFLWSFPGGKGCPSGACERAC